MLCGMSTITRKSLPLSARDMADLEKLRASSRHQAALSELAGEEVTGNSSEAAILHAVYEAGLRAVRREVEAAGYQQIASEYDLAARKAVARRRRPSWADE